MILILSANHDPHAAVVARKLGKRGTPFLWFDPAEFPSRCAITVSLNSENQSRYVLEYQSEQIDLHTVSAIWHRRPGIPEPDQVITDDRVYEWVSTESQSFIEGIWNTLDCLHVPGVDHVRYAAENKLKQLVLASHLGFLIPRTAITNQPACLLKSFSDFGGAAISKVFSNPLVCRSGGKDLAEEEWSAFSRPIRRRDLASYHSMRFAPTIIQEYVPKAVEIRATVVGCRIFAAAIHSQDSHRTRHDWRHYDGEKVLYEEHTLPDGIAALCIALVQNLNLTFGAIDLVLRPDGKYVFLEINPSGQWLWIENLTKLPIAEAIADLLSKVR